MPSPTRTGATPTVYALLQILPPEPLLATGPEHLPPEMRDFAAYRRTQAVAIKSRPVVEAALKREGIKQLAVIATEPDPAGWLEANLQVELLEGDLLRVGLNGTVHQGLLALVDAVVQSYLEEVVFVERQRQTERVAYLEKAASAAVDTLRVSKMNLAKMSETLGLLSPARSQLLSRRVEECDRELRRVRLTKRAAEARSKGAGAEAKEQLAVLLAQEKLLKDELEQALAKLDKARNEGTEMQALREEIKIQEEVARRLQLRVELARIELEQRPAVQRFANATVAR
jgi:hypothetical protein